MKEAMISEILRLVRKEVQLYQRLLADEEQRLDLLLKEDHEGVEALGARVQALVQDVKECERRIKDLLPGVPLIEWVTKQRHPYRTILYSLVKEFRYVVEELNRVNSRNFGYVQRSFCYTSGMLQRVFADDTGYDAKGTLQMNRRIAGKAFNY